jgi:type I restriction enzyme S subunit
MPNSTPQGWKTTRFEDFADNIAERVEPSETDLQIYVGLEHLDSETLKIKRHGKTSDVEGTKLKVNPGDIIFGRRRAYQRKVAIADFKGICSAHAMILRPKKNMHKDFFPFFLQSDMFMDRAMKISVGSLSPTINWKALKKQEFPLPAIQEQQKMAKVLWASEESIIKMDETIDASENFKKALMKHLFTYGAVGFDEAGKTGLKKTKICFVPNGWEVVSLRNIVADENDIVAGPFGSNLKVSDYRPEGVPIIRLQNIERNKFIDKDIKYVSSEKAEELSYHSYQAGDLALAKLGDPIGKTCTMPSFMGKGIVVADVVRIRLSPKKAVNSFIEYMLNSSICFVQLRKETIGTTRPRVNISQVRNLKFPLPPLPEQRRIAGILSKLDQNIEAFREHKYRLIALKKRLLNGLLSGEIRLRRYHK